MIGVVSFKVCHRMTLCSYGWACATDDREFDDNNAIVYRYGFGDCPASTSEYIEYTYRNGPGVGNGRLNRILYFPQGTELHQIVGPAPDATWLKVA